MKRQASAILIFSILIIPFVYAGEETAGDNARGMGKKFGRGLWNVVSSVAEIPCAMNTDIKDKGAVGAATGFGKGIAFMLRRILVGVTEVGTFMIPMEPTLPPVCSKTTVV